MQINPWLALGVFASTAATDAVYVLFNAAVSARRRVPAATWSSVWYLLSAFAVISYTRKLDVHRFCGSGVVGWRVRLDDAIAQAGSGVRAEKCVTC